MMMSYLYCGGTEALKTNVSGMLEVRDAFSRARFTVGLSIVGVKTLSMIEPIYPLRGYISVHFSSLVYFVVEAHCIVYLP